MSSCFTFHLSNMQLPAVHNTFNLCTTPYSSCVACIRALFFSIILVVFRKLCRASEPQLGLSIFDGWTLPAMPLFWRAGVLSLIVGSKRYRQRRLCFLSNRWHSFERTPPPSWQMHSWPVIAEENGGITWSGRDNGLQQDSYCPGDDSLLFIQLQKTLPSPCQTEQAGGFMPSADLQNCFAQTAGQPV